MQVSFASIAVVLNRDDPEFPALPDILEPLFSTMTGI